MTPLGGWGNGTRDVSKSLAASGGDGRARADWHGWRSGVEADGAYSRLTEFGPPFTVRVRRRMVNGILPNAC